MTAILTFLSNLAAFLNTPAGQGFFALILRTSDPTPAELHAAISALPRPEPPPLPKE